MFYKNLPSLISICAIFISALVIGIIRSPDWHKTRLPPAAVKSDPSLQEQIAARVPSIGRIQVLNGCGIDGAADQMTDFLRKNRFNVANTGNASSWNYRFTLVISHVKDMTIARQIAATLSTDRIVLMRKEGHAYDVTVILGSDFEERIR
ncbi:MAG: LytR C-terminal domain-containing protein [Chitinispirillaceae bacterium]|nr:LytR C-terminal domain-containing protein [Chitinispirillaceae bacterium]